MLDKMGLGDSLAHQFLVKFILTGRGTTPSGYVSSPCFKKLGRVKDLLLADSCLIKYVIELIPN